MSLAQITEKIEQDAKNEAKKILDTARERESEIKKDAEREIKNIEDASSARFERERPEIFKRREIVARLDVEKLNLGARRKLISDVFDAGLELLKSLGKDQYVAFFEKLLKKAYVSGDEVVELSGHEKHIDREWLDAFNARNSTRITLSDERQSFSGGFVLNNGRVSINCSWEMLMRVAQERFESDVVKRLFPD
jgi:V/A-type H+-transporting ATPase subunit E